MTRRAQKGCSRKFQPEKHWRPRDRRGGTCGYTFDGESCQRRGAHHCEPRANKVVSFFAELLVHTKGPWARRAFVLADWQEQEIIRPLFGEVAWSVQWKCYVRRYRVAYIILARKNGKSELAAGILLYLLVGDDEEAAEIYGAAKDTKQARKVWQPAERMRTLSPLLSKRLGVNKNEKRIFDERTASFYEIITADATGELGHNPHGFVLDEVLSQRDGSLWEAMLTAQGARLQPLFLAATTETNDPFSFGAELIDEAERIQAEPERAPHIFSYCRKLPRTEDELERLQQAHPDHPDLPVSTDPLDERNWKWPNPALDVFLSREDFRRAALEVKNEPAKRNGFCQFRTNQRMQQTTRFIALDAWDACIGERLPEPEWIVPKLKGQRCFAGLDLSSKLDMTAWCLLFDNNWAWWRFWLPEDQAKFLDGHTGGQVSQWAEKGWITLTEGDVIDYDRVYADIELDHQRFAIADITYDPWSGEPVRQEIDKRTGLTMLPLKQTYDGMTAPMNEFRRLLKEPDAFFHGGNPVARWHADSVEAKSPSDDPDRFRPAKPDRMKTGKRIDGMPTLFMAIDGRMRRGAVPEQSEAPPSLVFGM